MAKHKIEIRFDTEETLRAEFQANLRIGGALCTDAAGAGPGQECEIVLVHPSSDNTLSLAGRVVAMIPTGGAGLALDNYDSGVRDTIAAFVENAGTRVRASRDTRSVHERMRGLSTVEQHKIAREGELGERVILERIYSKAVWKELLENPRLSVPEVSRIAKMGSLPLPLMEMILGNRSWLAGAQVRRALLTNPRLSREQAARVLALVPRHELKLMHRQTSYTANVREAAKKLLKLT